VPSVDWFHRPVVERCQHLTGVGIRGRVHGLCDFIHWGMRSHPLDLVDEGSQLLISKVISRGICHPR
jgi:hypothetical protein